METQNTKSKWVDQLKTYRQSTSMVADIDVRRQPIKPQPRIQNPVTHQFYDKQNEAIYNENVSKYRTQALNMARDRQLRQQSTFDFVQQKERYPGTDQRLRHNLENYSFQQPHIKPKGYVQPIPKVRDIKQTRSDDVRDTFRNYTDPKLPLFAGKQHDQPCFGGKRIIPQQSKFELGYDEKQKTNKNTEKLYTKRLFPERFKSTFELGYKDM